MSSTHSQTNLLSRRRLSTTRQPLFRTFHFRVLILSLFERLRQNLQTSVTSRLEVSLFLNKTPFSYPQSLLRTARFRLLLSQIFKASLQVLEQIIEEYLVVDEIYWARALHSFPFSHIFYKSHFPPYCTIYNCPKSARCPQNMPHKTRTHRSRASSWLCLNPSGT